MKFSVSLVIISSFCSTLAQPQYALQGGNYAIIQWSIVDGFQIPNRFTVTLTPANTGHPRTNFARTRAVQNRMDQLNSRLTDERGHIIASQLGGPAKTWNLFPQTRNLNRNVGDRSILTSWFDLENEIAEFLNRGGNRQVRYEIQFHYKNTAERRRPSDVTVTAVFFENGRRTKETFGGMQNEDRQNLGVPRQG